MIETRRAGPGTRLRVALFVTCLVDQLFPGVGRAAVSVLRRAGVEVEVVQAQTCCGQVLFNDGAWPEARALARRHLEVFAGADAVVAPSGSCVTMVRRYYGVLLGREPEVAARTYELSEFLVRRLGVVDLGAAFPARVTYVASCHGLRELHLHQEPLRLLQAVRGLELMPLDGVEECCGFGGAFSLKMADLSGAMLDAKLDAIRRSGAEVVTATDVSCLMHLRGGLRRQQIPVRALHLAEILAGADVPVDSPAPS